QLRFAYFVAIEQQIEIDCTRALCQVACATEGVFHLQQSRHYFFWRRKRIAAELGNHVQKSWLRGSFHRLSFINLRKPDHFKSSVEHSADAQQQISSAVAEI